MPQCAAVAQVQSLAWERLAEDVAKKKKKKKEYFYFIFYEIY